MGMNSILLPLEVLIEYIKCFIKKAKNIVIKKWKNIELPWL
jgi:hypothetical protein